LKISTRFRYIAFGSRRGRATTGLPRRFTATFVRTVGPTARLHLTAVGSHPCGRETSLVQAMFCGDSRNNLLGYFHVLVRNLGGSFPQPARSNADEKRGWCWRNGQRFGCTALTRRAASNRQASEKFGECAPRSSMRWTSSFSETSLARRCPLSVSYRFRGEPNLVSYRNLGQLASRLTVATYSRIS